MTGRACVHGTRAGRLCRRRGSWQVVGDLVEQRYCKLHATVVALRPGASAVITRPGSGRLDRVNVDPDGQHAPAGVEQLVEAYERVTCVEGYERVRRAWFHPNPGVEQVHLGNRDVTHAQTDARERVGKVNAATSGVSW